MTATITPDEIPAQSSIFTAMAFCWVGAPSCVGCKAALSEVA